MFELKTIRPELFAFYRELDPQALIKRIYALLAKLTPLDATFMTRLDLSLLGPTERCLISYHPEHALNPAMQQGAQAALLRFAFSPSQHLLDSDRWLPLADFIQLAYPAHGEECFGILAKLSGPHALVCPLGQFAATVHFLTIARWETAFTNEELSLFNQLLPHFQVGFRNAIEHGNVVNFAVQAEALIENIPGAYGFCNHLGDLIWLQNRARIWLDEFFPDRKRLRTEMPACLQQQLHLCLRNQLQHAELIQERQDVLLKVSIVASATGGWTLHLQRKPIYILAHFRPLPLLTRRQNQVLEWLLQGKRNSEIGVILKLSERTVEKHVSLLLLVLGVESRFGLAGRVMELWDKLPVPRINNRKPASGG